MTHKCGCTVEVHAPSGVLRSVVKCPHHRAMMRDPATLDAAYYAELGVVDADGRPRETAHVAELVEALGELPPAPDPDALALEIGCGASPYVGAIRRAGWGYIGADGSPWAARWMRDTHGAVVYPAVFEELAAVLAPGGFGLILAAHVLEHLEDAPGAIRRAAGLLAPGGEMWVVVPDDSDLGNPDHLWFHRPETLRACALAAGLEVVREATRRYVAHENFLYLSARRPG